jgi:D-alanyl-D-alanine carboxypeptidase/D-alanyl-D-alanine-endopeptidase (penicillin-binding protein 4)
MAAREQRHASRWRRWWSWLPEGLVLVVVLGAFANAQWHLGHRWFGLTEANPRSDPAAVAAPLGLDLAAGRTAPPVGVRQPPGRIDPAAVQAALAPLISDPALGKHVSIAVSELATGRVVLRHGAASVTPASTMKLLTTTAALEKLGPMARFTTKVVGSGNRVTLVGGGDPFLASAPHRGRAPYPARADLLTLARRTAAALQAAGTHRVVLSYDASLFTGPAVNPHWPATYVPENVVPPISALWVDEGRDGGGHYVNDPASAAGAAFRTALRHAGVRTAGPALARSAPAGAPVLASVQSAPLGEIVQQTLAVSDNNAAEVISRHVGEAVDGDASSTGGAAGVREVLGGLGVPLAGSQIYDGSGLSREDRLTPGALLGVLGAAASPRHPELREALTGLPVAGFSGSLQWRFDKGPAQARGRVRAKTGTLSGVHGLAGVATDVEGGLMAFVLITDRVAPAEELAAQHQVDLMAAALGACRCGPAS